VVAPVAPAPVQAAPVAPAPAPIPRPKVEERYAPKSDYAPKAEPAAQPARQDRGPGWLSDLLARASRDEDEAVEAPAPVAPARPVAPAPQAPADLLTTLLETIGTLVVHEQAVDAWDAYLRGDAEPFARPLYSRRGAETFDEVRRRYEREGQFRAMIDAYIAKFEELLREVAPRDRDASISRSILASDEGKVGDVKEQKSGVNSMKTRCLSAFGVDGF